MAFRRLRAMQADAGRPDLLAGAGRVEAEAVIVVPADGVGGADGVPAAAVVRAAAEIARPMFFCSK